MSRPTHRTCDGTANTSRHIPHLFFVRLTGGASFTVALLYQRCQRKRHELRKRRRSGHVWNGAMFKRWYVRICTHRETPLRSQVSLAGILCRSRGSQVLALIKRKSLAGDWAISKARCSVCGLQGSNFPAGQLALNETTLPWNLSQPSHPSWIRDPLLPLPGAWLSSSDPRLFSTLLPTPSVPTRTQR
jgi:hypothetical protein